MLHKYRLNGFNIVLDVHSGGVHLVDGLTYAMLDMIEPPFSETCPQNVVTRLSEEYAIEEIECCYKEIAELHEDNILFSEDDYERYAKTSIASPVKAMCLNIAHDCNLRCKYCFASTGDFGAGRKLMSLETGKKAIDFLIKQSGDRENLELDFFGGEPLMNFETVKQLVEYGRIKEKEYGKKIRFTLTTNGLLLDDDKINFINEEMSNIVLSIDGRKEVNDEMRITTGGNGCYDVIMPKYQKLVALRGDKEYYVRGTFTRNNLDFSEDVFSLYEQGFDQISVEPVVGDPAEEYAITLQDLPKIYNEYEKLADRILENEKKGNRFNFFHFMLDLDQGPCAIKRLRGCGCGNDYVAVTPDGDIYPCHQFVGVDEYKMGNVDDGTFDESIKAFFSKVHVYTKPECKECWAKFYCSGGCNANNHKFAGDVRNAHKLSCELQKKRIECAIALKAARQWDDEED